MATAALLPDELNRYSRHIMLPEVGIEGQKRLKSASVLVIGVGGLGSPLSMYLAAAGVGRIGLVDFDVVERSNLQRQLLHSTADVGRPKLESAKARLIGINPGTQIDCHEARLSSLNALRLFTDYDVIVDGTDNFPTRYLVNDACVLLKKPNVYGSIFQFEGQASVFYAEKGPCYRCLYPEPPPAGLVPSCAEGGVLGVLPGVIGAIQATETLKLLLGVGDLMIGRLLLFDALGMRFREMKLHKNENCLVCGKAPKITALIDYEAFCGGAANAEKSSRTDDFEILPAALKQKLDAGENVFILDVREPHEYEIVNLRGNLIPLKELPQRVGELDRSREIVVHCHHGMRSAKAVEILRESGFKNVRNLAGGIDLWAEQVDPSLPRY